MAIASPSHSNSSSVISTLIKLQKIFNFGFSFFIGIGDIQIAAGQNAQSVKGVKSSRFSVLLIGVDDWVINESLSSVGVMFKLGLVGGLVKSKAFLQGAKIVFTVNDIASFDGCLSNEQFCARAIASVFNAKGSQGLMQLFPAGRIGNDRSRLLNPNALR